MTLIRLETEQNVRFFSTAQVIYQFHRAQQLGGDGVDEDCGSLACAEEPAWATVRIGAPLRIVVDGTRLRIFKSASAAPQVVVHSDAPLPVSGRVRRLLQHAPGVAAEAISSNIQDAIHWNYAALPAVLCLFECSFADNPTGEQLLERSRAGDLTWISPDATDCRIHLDRLHTIAPEQVTIEVHQIPSKAGEEESAEWSLRWDGVRLIAIAASDPNPALSVARYDYALNASSAMHNASSASLSACDTRTVPPAGRPFLRSLLNEYGFAGAALDWIGARPAQENLQVQLTLRMPAAAASIWSRKPVETGRGVWIASFRLMVAVHRCLRRWSAYAAFSNPALINDPGEAWSTLVYYTTPALRERKAELLSDAGTMLEGAYQLRRRQQRLPLKLRELYSMLRRSGRGALAQNFRPDKAAVIYDYVRKMPRRALRLFGNDQELANSFSEYAGTLRDAASMPRRKAALVLKDAAKLVRRITTRCRWLHDDFNVPSMATILLIDAIQAQTESLRSPRQVEAILRIRTEGDAGYVAFRNAYTGEEALDDELAAA